MYNDPLGDAMKQVDMPVGYGPSGSGFGGQSMSDWIAGVNLYMLTEGQYNDDYYDGTNSGGGANTYPGFNSTTTASTSTTGSPNTTASVASNSATINNSSNPSATSSTSSNSANQAFSFSGNNMLAAVVIQGGFSINPFSVKSGTTTNGAYMFINYTSPSGNMLMFKSYQWIQTVSSSGEFDKRYGLHLHSPHVDGTRDSHGKLNNYPFYWTTFGLTFDSVTPFTQYSASFRDYPSGESWFEAEVTLVGVGFNGNLSPLGSYSWGYSITNNGAPIFLGPMFSPTPSSFQENIIQNYNNRIK
jgi:hypothetical protein